MLRCYYYEVKVKNNLVLGFLLYDVPFKNVLWLILIGTWHYMFGF